MSFDSAMLLRASPVASAAARATFSAPNSGSPSSGEKPLVAGADRQAEPSPQRVLGADDHADQTSVKDPQAERQLQLQVANLANRDREVRAHELAHASVGGQYAGGATYSFTRGPDGKSYAVGGEVGIDLSAIAGNPQATISKMEIVQRAALAPAEPSSQDLRVAAQAQALAAQARVELAAMRRDEGVEASDERQKLDENEPKADDSTVTQQFATEASSLDLYLQLNGAQSSDPVVDLFA